MNYGVVFETNPYVTVSFVRPFLLTGHRFNCLFAHCYPDAEKHESSGAEAGSRGSGAENNFHKDHIQGGHGRRTGCSGPDSRAPSDKMCPGGFRSSKTPVSYPSASLFHCSQDRFRGHREFSYPDSDGGTDCICDGRSCRRHWWFTYTANLVTHGD